MAGLGRHWGEEALDELLPWTAPQARGKWQTVLNSVCAVESSENQ